MTILLEHLLYLRDRRRMTAYEAAIRKTVRRGDLVLDLGCGTGVLGLLALKHGAAHVYAIDQGPIIHVARRISADNGLADRVTHFQGHSTEIKTPRRADCVVSELLGHFGLNEGILETILDANRRLLKPHARAVPVSFDLRMEPVSASKFSAREYRMERVCGMNFRRVRELMRNRPMPVAPGVGRPLAPSQAVASFSLTGLRANPYPVTGDARFTARRAGTLHGFSGYFDALLAAGVRLASNRGTHWRRMFFPVDPPVKVEKGDRLDFSITYTDLSTPHWSGEARRGRQVLGRFAHSSWLGDVGVLTRKAISAGARPRLTAPERDRVSVLKLMDGTRSIDQILDELKATDGNRSRNDWKARLQELCLRRGVILDGEKK